MALFILQCVTRKPPMCMFNCSFKGAPHPFFSDVYRFAEKVHPRLAGYMECCIAM